MPLSDSVIQAFHQSGLTQEELANKLGVRRPTISDWLTGKTQPRGRNLEKLKEVLGVTGRNTIRRTRTNNRPAQIARSEEDMVFIPSLSIEASAGEGFNVEIEIVECEIALPEWFARQRFAVEPSRVRRIVASGNSMEPTIRPGERVWIVLMEPGEMPIDGGVYILRSPHGLLVKRIYYDAEANGKKTNYYVRIHSDNPEVGTYRLPLEVFQRDYHAIAQYRCSERDL